MKIYFQKDLSSVNQVIDGGIHSQESNSFSRKNPLDSTPDLLDLDHPDSYRSATPAQKNT